MKDAELQKLFSDLHAKFDNLLNMFNSLSASITPGAIEQKPVTESSATISQPVQATLEANTAKPAMQVESPQTDSSVKSVTGKPGFFSTNLEHGPSGDIFRSTINGKVNPLEITSIDEDTFITVELFKDFKINDKAGVQGTLIKINQKDYTHEIDIDNLKVMGLVLVGMTLAMRVRAWDNTSNNPPIEEVIVTFTVIQ